MKNKSQKDFSCEECQKESCIAYCKAYWDEELETYIFIIEDNLCLRCRKQKQTNRIKVTSETINSYQLTTNRNNKKGTSNV
jgi:hypothetical protein